MLDELLLGGEIQESSKKNVLKAIAAQDLLQEVLTLPIFTPSNDENYAHCQTMSLSYLQWLIHGSNDYILGFFLR